MQWRDVSSTQIKKTISIWISSYLKQFENSVQWINTGKLLIEKSRIAALFFQKKKLHNSLHDLMTPMGFTHNQLTYYYPMELLPSSALHTTTPTFSLTLNYLTPPRLQVLPPSALHLTTLPPSPRLQVLPPSALQTVLTYIIHDLLYR